MENLGKDALESEISRMISKKLVTDYLELFTNKGYLSFKESQLMFLGRSIDWTHYLSLEHIPDNTNIDDAYSIGPDLLPNDFKYPIIAISDFDRVTHHPKSTPFGILPSSVKTPDGNFFAIYNTYLLSMNYDIRKAEVFVNLYFDEPQNEYQEITLQLDENMSRLTYLQPGDYEQLESILHDIQTGRLKEFKDFKTL